MQKKGGDDGTVAVPQGWAAVPGAVIVREKHEKKSNTRDEIDERLETEQVHHLGQITNEVIIFVESRNGISTLLLKKNTQRAL